MKQQRKIVKNKGIHKTKIREDVTESSGKIWRQKFSQDGSSLIFPSSKYVGFNLYVLEVYCDVNSLYCFCSSMSEKL